MLDKNSTEKISLLHELDFYCSLNDEDRKHHKFSPITMYLMNAYLEDNFIDNYFAYKQALEISFNIFDHNDDILLNENPLHEIQLHPIHSSLSSELDYIIDKFSQCEIYKHFGISLQDFLNMPSEMCRRIFKIRENSLIEENNKKDELLKDTKDQLRELDKIK